MENQELKNELKLIKETLSLIMIQNNKNQELLEKLQQTQNIIASGTLMLNEEQNQKIDNQFEQLKLIIKPFEEKLIMLSNESLKIIKRF